MPVDHTPQPPSGWQASDYNYKAMAYDPAAFVTTSTPLSANGTIWFTRVAIRQRCLVSNIIVDVVTIGATLTANQCLAALYSPSGTLLSATGNQATAWLSLGPCVMALTSPQDCQPGLYDVAFFANGTTRPAFFRTASDANANLGLTTTSIRYGSADTGRTTTFPSTLGTKTAALPLYWAALS